MAVEGIYTLAKVSVDKAIQEAHYLRRYRSFVNEFDDQRKKLSDVARSVRETIEDAKNRTDPKVERWLLEAEALIEQAETTEKTKCFFGVFPNCIWRNRRSKELERMVLKIRGLIQNSNSFPRVPPRKAELSNFMYFESRKKEYELLKEALRNERNHMIGLLGMGGIGKTAMAVQVGKELEESKVFDRVIFVFESREADVERIQTHIARHLGLTLEEGKGSEEHALSLWSRIANGGEKILIILDDGDKDLNLKDIGIPHGQHQKGACCVLITTRAMDVCEELGCDETIKLGLLSDEDDDAVNLFLLHADKSVDSSSEDLKEVALAIVNECGGLPLAIVAVARALKKRSLEKWREALRKLQNPNVDPISEGLYNSLKLSYDYLGENSKSLFLLCSLFPEDSEIPVELLSRCAIGLGLFGEVDNCDIARRQVHELKAKLLAFSLLLEAENECVKMHDSVREMALHIAQEEFQVVMDSSTSLKENTRYSSWIIDGFYNSFHGSKLELLLLWINVNGSFQVLDTLFEGVMNLKVLFFICKNESSRVPAPSLPQSIHSLRNIRTLLLENWELGDLSVMGSLQSLVTLELINCLFPEFPIEIRGLTRLRLLALRNCVIERNNPFQVIEGCLRLEELFYVHNSDILCEVKEDEERPPITGLPPALTRFHIIGSPFPEYSLKVSASTSTCFKPGYLKEFLSEQTIKFLAAKAEILELGECYGTNLIPDIFHTENGGPEDLIRLHLYSWFGMEYLIHREHLPFGVTIFSKLLELKLSKMDVIGLSSHSLPSDFLKKLEILELKECLKLESALFKDELHLDMLKSIKLESCSMTSLFMPSTAQSLQQLEMLEICECHQLLYIITGLGEEIADHHQRSHGSMFPKLKFLYVKDCDKLRFVLPIYFVEELQRLEGVRIVSCMKLAYIFDKYPNEGGLYRMGRKILSSLNVLEVSEMPDFIDIFPAECYHPESPVTQNSPPTTRDDIRSHSLPSDSFKKLEILELKWCLKLESALFKDELHLDMLKSIKLESCSMTSLFMPSTAQSLQQLEMLEICECHQLLYIITGLGEEIADHHQRSHGSMFPKLKFLYVKDCDKLRFVLPIYFVEELQRLEGVRIVSCMKLAYIFDKYPNEGGLYRMGRKILSSLNVLEVSEMPDFIDIFPAECYHPESPVTQNSPPTTRDDIRSHSLPSDSFKKLEILELKWCLKLESALFKDELHLDMLKSIKLESCSMTSLFMPSTAQSLQQLEMLEICECHQLLYIITGLGEEIADHHQRSHGSMFPKLKFLYVKDCDKLRFVLPIYFVEELQRLEGVRIVSCMKLAYIFDKYPNEGGLYRMGRKVLSSLNVLEVSKMPDFIDIFPAECYHPESPITQNSPPTTRDDIRSCCFKPKSSATSIDNPLELKTEIINKAVCLLRPPLDPSNIKEIKITQRSDLTSLFTLRIASLMLKLEKLEVGECHGLQHLITDDGDDHRPWDYISIFPKLQEVSVWNCGNLESLFPASHFKTLNYLKSLRISGTDKLKYVLGQCKCNRISTQNVGTSDHPGQESSESELNMSNQEEDEEQKYLAMLEQDRISVTEDKMVEREAGIQKIIMKRQASSAKTRPFMPSNDSQNVTTYIRLYSKTFVSKNIDKSVGEGPPSEKENKAISSLHLEQETSHPGPSKIVEIKDTSPLSKKKATMEVDEKDSEIHEQNNSIPNLTEDGLVRKEVENEKIILEQATTEKNEVSAREVHLLEKCQKATSSIHSEPVIPHPGPLTSTKEFHEKESMGDREALSDNTQEVGHINPQFEEDDDLITLFRIAEEGADIRGRIPYVSDIDALKDDDKVVKAFSEVEALLKMNVSEVTSSEDNSLRLENALNFLSSHYSEDEGAPSRRLKAKIDSMHQEISSILSSFKQASARLVAKDTLTIREEAASTLVSEIHESKKSMQEAQRKEAELKEHISRLQAELELEKVNAKWLSCEGKWLKTLLLQQIYLKQKLGL